MGQKVVVKGVAVTLGPGSATPEEVADLPTREPDAFEAWWDSQEFSASDQAWIDLAREAWEAAGQLVGATITAPRLEVPIRLQLEAEEARPTRLCECGRAYDLVVGTIVCRCGKTLVGDDTLKLPALGWTYCTDGLPEEGREVLIATVEGTVTTASLGLGRWWQDTMEWEREQVYAWRPLPEPPPVREEP